VRFRNRRIELESSLRCRTGRGHAFVRTQHAQATSVKKYTARLAWAVGESGSMPSVCGMNGRTRIDATAALAMAWPGACR